MYSVCLLISCCYRAGASKALVDARLEFPKQKMKSRRFPSFRRDLSFEVSDWISAITNRLDNIARRQNIQMMWIRMAKRFYKTKKLQIIREHHHRFSNQKDSARQAWQSFSEKAFQRDKEARFRSARKAILLEQNSRAEIQRAMNSVPKPIQMRKPKPTEEDSYDYDPHRQSLTDLWRSLVNRFVKQSLFQNLNDALIEMQKQKIHDREIYREQWETLSTHLVREATLDALAMSKQAMHTHYILWKTLVSRKVLRTKSISMKAEHRKWSSRTWQTEDEVRQVWMAFSRKLRHNWRSLQRIRESIALRKITNFVMYVIIPRRASFVALAFKPTFLEFGRITSRRQIRRSVTTIKNALRRRMCAVAEAFAEDWGHCLAEACSSVAAYQVAPPEVVVFEKRLEEEELSDSEPPLQFEEYPTKIIKVDVLEEDSDAPVQLDFDDELGPRVHFKSPMKSRVDVMEGENVEINIDNGSSESSSDVKEERRPILAISSPAMKEFKRDDDEVLKMMAPVVVPEGVHKSAKKVVPKRTKIAMKPGRSGKKSLKSIMKRFGCSELEDLGEDETDGTELDFRFDEDPSVQRSEESPLEEAVEEEEQEHSEVAPEPSCNMIFEESGSEEVPNCAFQFEKSSEHLEEEEQENHASGEDSEGPRPRLEISSIDETDEDIICRDYSD